MHGVSTLGPWISRGALEEEAAHSAPQQNWVFLAASAARRSACRLTWVGPGPTLATARHSEKAAS